MEPNLLARRAGTGDEAAFETLVLSYQNMVYSMALRLLGSKEDALDVSQEVFLRVWRALPEYKADSKFTTWLYRIVVNLCTDHRRKMSRLSALSLTLDDDAGDAETQFDVPDESKGPETVFEQTELSESLRQAVKQLKPEWKEAFVLRELADMSYSEIADALGVEEGTVKSRLFRARRQLQEILREGGNIPSVSPSKNRKGGDK